MIKILKLFVLIVTLSLFTGCGMIPNEQSGSDTTDGTPVPTPTRDPSGYQAIDPESCLIADWTTLQTGDIEGNLLAWQPQQSGAPTGTSNLAYLGPTDKSSWYTGELMLAVGPDYTQHIKLAPNTLATGDLTWSPSGRRLAFLAYRQNEGLYTAAVVSPDATGLTDLFPSDLARTDNRSSQKAIIGWKGENTLQVMSSCGEECRLAYDFEMGTTAGPILTPTVVENYRELNQNLEITRNELVYTPEVFPKNMRSPHWSPNDNLVTYIDRRGLLWLLKIDTKTMYLLDIGLRDVYETQWALDSASLAVRAEDRIFVFEIPCRTNK